MNLDEQMTHFDRHVDDAWLDLSDLMGRYESTIKSVARARLMHGYAEFGDSMFEKDNQLLIIEMIEEVADAINYVLARYQ